MEVCDECCPNCRSVHHGDELANILPCQMLTDTEILSFLTWKCSNYFSLHDSTGRGLVHVAAATGRLNLLRHFVQRRDCLNEVSPESGYTPLHYSVLYGQIHCAVRLLQLGCNRNIVDHDFLTPFDLIGKDKMKTKTFDPYDVYVWGTNNNYTLGVGHNRQRQLPEPQEFSRRKETRVSMVVMQKFHSVLLDTEGIAWSCGHGAGGRLGLGTESAALEPKRIKLPSQVTCCRISCGEDHTVLLSNDGVAWTCGLNNYQQLGISPTVQSVLTPKNIRVLPPLTDVCAGQHHTLFWTENQIFSCGLNSGQLGHVKDPNGSNVVVGPRAVTIFRINDNILSVATCPTATAVLSSQGAVYVFNGYGCRRINSRNCPMKGISIKVFGGQLDAKSNPTESGDLRVIVVAQRAVYVWKESYSEFLPLTYSIQRELMVKDLALTPTGCIMCTNEGDAYLGFFRDQKKGHSVELIDVRRLPHIYRALSVSTDQRGDNFAVVQGSPFIVLEKFLGKNPNRSLRENLATFLDETSEDDCIHDIVFKVEGRKFPAHKFIVFFGNDNTTMKTFLDENEVMPVMELQNMPVNAFEQVLNYVYTMKLDPQLHSECKEKKSTDGAKQKYKYSKEVADARYVARRLGVNGLLKELDGKRVTGKSLDRLAGGFDATLQSADGKQLPVHKCVLIARLEYFRVMLTHGWRESAKTNLIVPVSGRILEALVDYLYTDGSSDVTSSTDLTFLCEVLVTADEFFCAGLKWLTEKAMISLLNFRNAVDVLQLATTYNAEYLREATETFISDNLAAFLEDRSLEILPDETLEHMSSVYRLHLPSSRKTKSLVDDIEIAKIKSIAIAVPVTLSLDEEIAKPESKTPKKKESKKRERRTSERQRLESVESTWSPPPPSAPVMTVRTPSASIEKLSTPVETIAQNKNVQIRLKAVVEAAKENFVVAESSINLKDVLSESAFPELNSPPEKSRPKVSYPKTSVIDIPKLSQRERRRQNSVSSPPTPQIDHRNAWAVIPPPSSLQTNNTNELSPERSIQLSSIIDSEWKERERAARLRNKPLALTQLEDRAIQELTIFYNAKESRDERITVQRLDATSLTTPIWVAINKAKHSYKS